MKIAPSCEACLAKHELSVRVLEEEDPDSKIQTTWNKFSLYYVASQVSPRLTRERERERGIWCPSVLFHVIPRNFYNFVPI